MEVLVKFPLNEQLGERKFENPLSQVDASLAFLAERGDDQAVVLVCPMADWIELSQYVLDGQEYRREMQSLGEKIPSPE